MSRDRSVSSSKVVHVVRYVSHYRVRFYEKVRAILADQNIDYQVFAGSAELGEQPTGGVANPDWVVSRPDHVISIGDRSLIWQNPALLFGADVVLLEQRSRALINIPALLLSALGRTKVGFIGHGRNLQAADSNSPEERYKRWFTRRGDHFFAYSEESAEIVQQIGVDEERVSILNNGLDTEDRVKQRTTALAIVDTTAAALGVRSENVVVYFGRIYELKRPEFLIEAAKQMRSIIPDLELIVVGEGPADQVVRSAAKCNSWIHFVGPKFDQELVDLVMLGRLCLMPGLVGLAAVESFVLGVPLATTEQDYHSPEFRYLNDGVDSLVLPRECTPQEYGDAVASLILDRPRLAKMRQACLAKASEFSTDGMAEVLASKLVEMIRSSR